MNGDMGGEFDDSIIGSPYAPYGESIAPCFAFNFLKFGTFSV